MSKKIYDSFDNRTKLPIDKRFSVTNLSEIDRPYEGLFTYQSSDEKFYKYSNGDWVDFTEDLINLINNNTTNIALQKYYVNVKEYGAKGDGTTDDTSSINSAISYLVSIGGGTLYFPKGIYKVTSQIIITNLSINIVGDNLNNSKIKFINCNGIKIDNSAITTTLYCSLENIALQSDQVGLYTALDYKGCVTTDIGKQLFVNKVRFSGVDLNTTWNIPVSLNYAYYSSIINCHFQGITSSTDPTLLDYVNFEKLSSGIKITNSTDVRIRDNQFYWVNTGVEIVNFSEAIYIEENLFVPCNLGVYSHDNTGDFIIIKNNHFDTFTGAVRLTTSDLSQILDNFVIKRGGVQFIGFDITAGYNLIRGNVIRFGGNGNEYGILIRTGSLYNTVNCNKIYNQDQYAIWLQTGANYNTINNNDGADDTLGIGDGGTSNSLWNNFINTVNARKEFFGSYSYAGETIPANTTVDHTVTISGANFGMFVNGALPYTLNGGVIMQCFVNAVNTVVVRFSNVTTGSITLTSGTIQLKVSV